MKTFYTQHNIGKVKYVVNYHNGKDKHPDGSDFFGIKTFKNKTKLAGFISELITKGYVKKCP